MVKTYEQLNEKVYSEILPNGLRVIVIPKPGFNKTFVCFAAKYGALVNRFVPRDGSDYVDMPLGIAHFLEHKMFDLPSGDDASTLFARYGLDSNAMTNYTMTAYLFSGAANITDGINLLLDFVQDPYFTDESVKKEQGIIVQELKMYLDDPNDALHLGLMQNLFHQYPLRYDVGGTVDSIMEITKEHLYKCYRTFYHPANMDLIVVGDPDNIFANQNNSVESVFNHVRKNQEGKKFPPAIDIKKSFFVENDNAYRGSGLSKMDIMMPKVAVGLKLPYEKYGENEALATELKLKILIEAVLGPTSDAFQEMLDLELINGNLYYEVYIDGFCGFIKIQANSHKPRQFIVYIKEKLLALNKITIDAGLFERFKKSVLGSFIKSLNNLDYLGFSYLEYLYKQSDIFAGIEAFAGLKREELIPMAKYFVPEALSDYVILPKKFSTIYSL